jgi:hypothetical protein
VWARTRFNENWRDTSNLQYLNLKHLLRSPVIQPTGAASRPGSLGWGSVRGPDSGT